jgi:hypothetical protein
MQIWEMEIVRDGSTKQLVDPVAPIADLMIDLLFKKFGFDLDESEYILYIIDDKGTTIKPH